MKMDLRSGYKGVVGLVFGNESSSDADSYVERLLDRISNGKLADDRRNAIIELQAVVSENQASQLAFGAMGFPVMLSVLKEEREDVEMVRGALETLVSALTPINHGKGSSNEVQPALMNTDLLSREADSISLLLSLLEEDDFYVRYYTLQLLTALLTNSPQRLQEAILTIPRGITRLMDMLMDREVIRNEALLLLTHLTREAEEIQKIVVFEGAFEKIFSIIREEGNSDGGVVVQDCLELLNNLLRNNASNQVLLRETIGLDSLISILKLRGSAFSFTQQKTINLLSALETIRLLIKGSDADTGKDMNKQANKTNLVQKKLLDHLLILSIESQWAPVAVRCAAMQCIGDLIIGDSKNRDLLASKILGEEPQVEPALNSILRIILRTSSMQEFIAADYVFKCFCEKNSDGQSMLASTLIPQPYSMSHATLEEDINMSFGSMLLHGLTLGENSGDLEICCRAASVLSHILKDNLPCKERVLRIEIEPPMQSLGAPEPLLHRMVKYSALASSMKGKDGKSSTSENSYTEVIILKLLITWLADCPSAVQCFLDARPHLTYLLELVSNLSETVCIRGFATVVLGECVIYTKMSRKPNARKQQHVPLIDLLILCYLLLFPATTTKSEAKCSSGCNLALASYYLWPGTNLTYITTIFGKPQSEILKYNPEIKNPDSIDKQERINVPFSCDCLNGDFLGHTFSYETHRGDTYNNIAHVAFSNLTTQEWLSRVNSYPAINIPDGVQINVTVNCSCGDIHVSKDYGLFATYPLRIGQDLNTVAAESTVPAELLQRYNQGSDFGAGNGIVFVPAKDENGKFPPLLLGSGISGGAIAGIVIGGAVTGLLLLALVLYFALFRRKKVVAEVSLLPHDQFTQLQHGCGSRLSKGSESSPVISPRLTGITVDKSVEFSYEELAKATNGFSIDNKIGQGGFGSVYYAELRDEKAAIKRMDMQASKEFLAELKVLTRVHHLNLVRLIGYCVEGSLFLVYEYIENGNLSQHLRGSGRDSLSWPIRVQIALDSARGLEYIHEHTVPVYIHRDIKSANILIDKNFRGKVADFGLTRLTEYGSSSLQTRLVGTFGYMPPEYAQYGEVSPKIDVYAFGVVLYELISGKEAIIKTNEIVTESKGLVALFEEVLSQTDPKEDLSKYVDPRLGDNYSVDSVFKMCQLARACTHENPQLRPSMRSIVVALMTLSSATEDWDVGSFYENQALVHLMAGR